MFLFLQAGSLGSGDCGDAMYQDLSRFRSDFATLLKEIFWRTGGEGYLVRGRMR